jgi:outer membrane lipoprotein-sorting protein
MNARKGRTAAIFLAILLAASCLLIIPGCGGQKSVGDIWQDMLKADKTIKSMHMNITMSYENTKFGSGQIEGTSVDISGDDVHMQKYLFGQDFAEVIKVNGRQYSRTMGSDKWTEVSVTVNAQSAVDENGQLSNLPSLSSASENQGVVTLDGTSAYHLAFTIPPENVNSVFSSVPAAELTANSGAKVDVWIDKDKFYTLKYEAVINNVLITDQIGYADRRIVNTVSQINEAITITAPI